MLYKDKVILQADVHEGAFLAAYDLKSGREVWKTPRDERINYSSPILVETQGRTELVTTSYHNVISIKIMFEP